MSKKSKSAGSKNPSNDHYDYSRIEKLRQDAWSQPQVRKNWEELDRMGLTMPQVQPEARQAKNAKK